MSLFEQAPNPNPNAYGSNMLGRPFHMLRTAWYCQNGCQMHWMGHKPDFNCPICNGEFITDDKAFLQKHPPPDLGQYAQAAATKYGKLPRRAKPANEEQG